MIVLLDVDGVVADFDAHYVKIARLTLGRQNIYVNFSGDAFSATERYGVNEEEARRVKRALMARSAVDMLPMPNAVEAVKRIDKRHDVYFVTAPFCPYHHTWFNDRQWWLEEHFCKRLSTRVVFTHHKHLVRGDVFVDDKLKNVKMWCGHNPEGTGICWDSPPYFPAEGICTFNYWYRLEGFLDGEALPRLQPPG